MTRKDFENLADAIVELDLEDEGTVRLVAESISDTLKQEYPRFERNRFLNYVSLARSERATEEAEREDDPIGDHRHTELSSMDRG